ncbi:MAG: transporter substrate-binding protein [Thermomicrobiales bacterium]|jgi:multiple sugar transport system substrate-binding protein|nr:transporter substrate-binding protein [Thermomicrobiales bacterium]
MQTRAVILAAALMLPLNAQAADLVVWWEEGWHPEEDWAVTELVAAFERETGKEVELVQYSQVELPTVVQEALEAGRPPDFAYGLLLGRRLDGWAYEGRLTDLSEAIGTLADLFDPDALEASTLFNARTGRRALYALPMGRTSNHLHVWTSLLERAGLTLADVPRGWEAFWAFWCDTVQPAVRRATGRDDIYGVGLSMAEGVVDADVQVYQFQLAYGAEWVTREGELVADDPAARARLVRSLDGYTVIYRKGCVPPDAVMWDGPGNNKAFLDQRVVMTPNETLSVPNALKAARPEDYHRNAATIDWPETGADGRPFPIQGDIIRAAVFEDGGDPALALEFVRFLVAKGGLARYLDEASERVLPPMRSLLERPFWLDPGDPHRMRSAIQVLTRPHVVSAWYIRRGSSLGGRSVGGEKVWSKAVHRVTADGWTAERAVDEAITRVKQILSE